MAKKRPRLHTKEELVEYLNGNQDTELPFVEEVWEVAVKNTSGKERKFIEIQEKDFDGNVRIKKIPNGSLNPVSKYFQLMALPQYRARGKELKEIHEQEKKEDLKLSSTIGDIMGGLDNSDENLFIKELVKTYFSTYTGDDLEYIIERLSDYYNNYEFNEGSDKFLVVSAVSDEITQKKMYEERAKGKFDENEIKRVRESYMKTLEGLELLKKQGGNLDVGKNKLTMWVDELERTGELNVEFEDYDDDKLGNLLKRFLECMNNSLYEE